MVNIEPAWQFYMRGVAFYTIFGLVLSLFISAVILMSIEPELDYGNALWHCYITVLTVGYGDVGLTTDSARLFAALHIIAYYIVRLVAFGATRCGVPPEGGASDRLEIPAAHLHAALP